MSDPFVILSYWLHFGAVSSRLVFPSGFFLWLVILGEGPSQGKRGSKLACFVDTACTVYIHCRYFPTKSGSISINA